MHAHRKYVAHTNTDTRLYLVNVSIISNPHMHQLYIARAVLTSRLAILAQTPAVCFACLWIRPSRPATCIHVRDPSFRMVRFPWFITLSNVL